MATIKSFKDKRTEEYIQPPIIVDIDIIEYFYAADMYDVLADDNLVRLINSNGFYKTAFCEAYDLDEITVTVDGKDTTWHGAPVGVPGSFKTFIEGSDMGIMGAVGKNVKMNNINKVNGE